MPERQRIFETDGQDGWKQILDEAAYKIRPFGLLLGPDGKSLTPANPKRPLMGPIMPEHGDPVEGAHLQFASGETTVYSKRTTRNEYAVVELGLSLPVKALVGSEVEYEVENPLFTATFRKRSYALGFGGVLLEAYAFSLDKDSLSALTTSKVGPSDPYQRLGSLLVDRNDPGNPSPIRPIFAHHVNHGLAIEHPIPELARE